MTQSLRMVTLDAWTVIEPEMFLPSTTAPSSSDLAQVGGGGAVSALRVMRLAMRKAAALAVPTGAAGFSTAA